MKNNLLLLFFLLLTFFSFAQAQQGFKFQATARDKNNNLVTNQAVSIRISILNDSNSGTIVYSETHKQSTNKFGLINIIIGEGTMLSGNFSTVSWGSSSCFIKLEMDIAGGSNYIDLGTTQILSVPYALYAYKAEKIKLNSGNGININGTIINNQTPDQVISLTGTGTLTVNGSYPQFSLSTSDKQSLSFKQDTLTISNGNKVYLPYIKKTETCNLTTEGEMRFNAKAKKMEYCNGTNWVAINMGTFPKATTDSVNEIKPVSVRCFGNTPDDGGATIFESGFCISNQSNPTIANKRVLAKSSKGAFAYTISGLNPNTTYYVKSYTINTVGINYGNEIIFKTIANLPTLSTTEANNITAISASSGGYISSDGGSNLSARGICWSLNSNPTIADFKTTDITTTSAFVNKITGLMANSTYYVRAFATNSAGTNYGNEVAFQTSPVVIDVEGNLYNIIVIGMQTWMKENLRTTKYNDGTTITNVTDNAAWAALTSPAYCWYKNNEFSYKSTYGALYNWYVGDISSNGNKNVCPVGWHVPTNADWTTLTSYITNNGFSGSEAKALKSAIDWDIANGTDNFSFSCLPSGYRFNLDGSYNGIGVYATFWSSTSDDTMNGWGRDFNIDDLVVPTNDSRVFGASIRCLKDQIDVDGR